VGTRSDATVDNAFAAIDAGVKEVLIGDAKDLLQNETAGTLIH
jgi:acetylglutamate kinase